MKRSIDAPSSY